MTHSTSHRYRVHMCFIILMLVALTFTSQVIAADGVYELDDPTDPWRTANAGVTDEVLPPYTPIVRDGKRVQCWGRSHTLAGLLPAGITSQGQQLLAKPLAVHVQLQGQTSHALDQRDDAFRFKNVAPHRCEYTSESGDDNLRMAADSSIEYDGLIRTDLTLSAERPVTVESLRIEFAFAPDAAIFHHLEARWGAEIYERSPTEPGNAVEYGWNPLVWVGNHDVGLTIVTESTHGWTSSDKGAIRIERTDDAVVLTMNIITEPREINEPLTLRIGLLATPMKPMPAARWRDYAGNVPGRTLYYTWHNPPEMKYFSYPQPSDFENTHARIAGLRAKAGKDGRVFYYTTTSATGFQADVVKRHFNDWVMAGEIFEGDEWKGSSGLVGVGACCPASGFSDFLAWALDQMMTHLDIDGLYIDNPGPYWCYNQRHGCGPGGAKTYPYFAVRDLHKRLYAIVHKHRPKTAMIWEHTSRTFNPLQLAWVDLYSDGEPWRNAKNYPREKLFRQFTRTYMDVTGTGHQVGAMAMYLDSIGVRTDGDWSHWLPSRVLPFGQMHWSVHGWLDGTPSIAVARARQAFGLGKEEFDFYRPHELPEWFHVGGKPKPGNDLVVCLWQRKRDRALLAVLGNWADHPIQARLHEKLLRGTLGECAMYDAATNVEFPGSMMVSVPANAFRIVRIERKVEK